MRVKLGMAGAVAAILGGALGGCASATSQASPEYLNAQVKQMSDDVFAVGIEARNADEYGYARCVAANYAKYQQVSEIGQIPGAPLHTRFLKNDQGQQVTYSYGVLQFTVATKGKDAPAEVLPVSETLARCAQQGIPTDFRAARAG